MKKTLIAFLLLTPQISLACDTCVEKAVTDSFADMLRALNEQSSSISSLGTSLDNLKNQIKDSGSDMVTSVNDFSDVLEDTLTTNNKNTVNKIQDVISSVDLQFTKLASIEEQLTISENNSVNSVMRYASMMLDSLIRNYETGSYSKFETYIQSDRLLEVYYSSLSSKEAFRKLKASEAEAWNKGDVSVVGRSTQVSKNLQSLIANSNELLSALNYGQVLTADQYNDLTTLTLIGSNPNPSKSNSPQLMLSVSAQQAMLFDLIIDKAPFIRIPASLHDDLYPFVPQELDYADCLTVAVLEGDRCTSVYAIVKAMEERSNNEVYLKSLNKSGKRAITSELLRIETMENIILARQLDLETARLTSENF